MLGLYDRTPGRDKIELDGWWHFVTDTQETGEAAGWGQDFPVAQGRRMWVPGVWETELGLEDYQGVGWYHRTFEVDEEGMYLLTFGAVAYRSRVWLNGVELGRHEGDFTAFQFGAYLDEGENELVVRADNRHTEETLPKTVVDWYPYGGITRSIFAEKLPAVFIENLHVKARADGTLSFTVYYRNISDEKATVPLGIFVDEQELIDEELTVGAGKAGSKVFEAKLDSPRLWSLEEPNLYTAVCLLDDDGYQERFGFRDIATDGATITLNGQSLWLRGVNRHEDHPDWGFALPVKLMKRDMDIIKQLGCNTIRGSHYPNSQAFLDLCDEEGILFFSEIPGWQYTARMLSQEPTLSLLKNMLQEMVYQYYNHPSIYVWSLHNESETHWENEDGLDVRKGTEELYALARSLDDSRLVTHVTMRYWNDRYLDLCDIICLNEYIGWYVEDIEGEDFPGYLNKMAELYPNKPMLITEFGAGGLSGYHSMARRKWSEEHQSQQLSRQIMQMRQNKNVRGCYIWQYCDILSNPARAITRPRTLNNKGVVDEFRRPKMAYYIVRDLFHRLAEQDKKA